MAPWKIVGEPRRYRGGASESADVAFGLRVDVHHDDGREAKINVERLKGSERRLTPHDARQVVEEHLDDDVLPSRIVLARAGRFVVAA